jgi:hypothetical protein
MKLKFSFLIIFIFLLIRLQAQQFSGTITNPLADPVQNARVILQYPNGDPENDTVYSDASGYYIIGHTVGINQIIRGKESLSYMYDVNILTVNIISENQLSTGRIIGIDGKLISEFPLHKTSSNTYTGETDLNATSGIIIFSDYFHSCKIPLLNVQMRFMWPARSASSELNTSKLFNKSAKDAYYHLLIQTDDLYQPVDSVLENIEPSQSYTYNFELFDWPVYFADITVSITGYEDALLEGTTVEINGDDLYLSEFTDINGQAFFNDIDVGNDPDDLLLPGSMDITIDAGNIQWYEDMSQDMQTISEGTYEFNYSLQATINDYIRNIYSETDSGDPISVDWLLKSSDEIITYVSGSTDLDGNGQINFQYQYPGELADLILISTADDFENDTVWNIDILPGNIQTTNVFMTPALKDYTVIINSKDGNGDDLPSVNWLVLDADSVLIGQGNTGSNSLDTLLFQDLDPNLDIILKTNKTEHEDYRLEANIIGDQESLFNTINTLKTYLYEVGVVAKDSNTGVALDSINVDMYLNGQLLMSGNSLGDTIANLNTIQPGHTLDLKALIKRNGYIDSDSIDVTLNEGQLNQLIHELEQVPVQTSEAYLWRIFRDPIVRTGTTTDIVISNPQFNVQDTIFAVNAGTAWRDTVEVNQTGTTDYIITYIPHVQNGIPLYDLTKTFTLSPNQTAQGFDDGVALEQQQKIKGKVKFGDTKNVASGVDVIVRDTNGNQIDSLRTNATGTFEFGPYPVGFEGTMDVHIPNTHANRADTLYFGHRGIPIIQRSDIANYTVSTGRLVFEEEVLDFADSVNVYNVGLVPAFWIDAETNQLAKVNPAHIWRMDGNVGWDLANLRERPINVYFKPTTINKQHFFDMAQRIEDNFGIPFEINEVYSSIPSTTITGLDTNYLNSIEDSTGINAEVVTGAGLTTQSGNDNLEDFGFHTTTDIRIRGPISGNQPTPYMIVEDERELLGRRYEVAEIPSTYYKSLINASTPTDLDTAKMVYDHINFGLIHNMRKLRIDPDEMERVHNGSWTIRPNDAADFYSTKTQNILYDENRWKYWDSTNIPDYNLKFFQ